jgi:putative membrane protein
LAKVGHDAAIMLTESLLAYAHFLAILTMVVFLSSEAALCRSDWLNAAVVRRLVRVDRILMVATLAVLITGLARSWLGSKGASWYWHQPLLHLKISLYVLGALFALKPRQAFRRWARELDAKGAFPGEAEIKATRRLVMIQAHILAVVPLVAAFLARGVWTR